MRRASSRIRVSCAPPILSLQLYWVLLAFAGRANAQVAGAQLRRACNGINPRGRQVVLATAIVVLMLFEAMTIALGVEKNRPLSACYFAAALYVVYLAAICWALRRTPRALAPSGLIASHGRAALVARRGTRRFVID